MPIIEVNHVTKEYQLGQLQSMKTTALNQWRRLTGQPIEERAPFKALDDVNFSIETGEVVGIIGHNGAGKSTLLKLLANISNPSSGSIQVKGKVAPLIEVGAGLVGDLTGRENIYLNGAILGIAKAEIKRKFDDIVAFAELEEFIDTPIKRYSSGMQVRLGFSIATSVESDILIVDEVLAVGDISFQRKSIGRMENLIKNEGKTVLIVGHNIRQLERICPRMLLLRHGRLALDGESGHVSKLFFDDSTKQSAETLLQGAQLRPTIDTEELEVRSIEVNSTRNANGISVVPLFSDLVIRIKIFCHGNINNTEINIGLQNAEMIFVAKASTSTLSEPVNLGTGESTIEIIIPGISLVPGPYGIGMGIYDWARRPIWAGANLLPLSIEVSPEDAPKLPVGTLTYFPASWTITQQK
ncbi:MAG: ABC transporter ATP-binding protein [Candidatus Nitrotoga sp.]